MKCRIFIVLSYVSVVMGERNNLSEFDLVCVVKTGIDDVRFPDSGRCYYLLVLVCAVPYVGESDRVSFRITVS